MKTLLVLAEHPDFATAIRAAVNPEQYRIVARTALEEAEPLLEHGLVDACIVDVELRSAREVWFLEKIRRKAPRCPVVLYTGAKQPEWEEEAYLQGVSHVLTKPVRGRLLTALLERLPLSPSAAPVSLPLPPVAEPQTSQAFEAAPARAAAQTLGVLRDVSGILSHSLNGERMLHEFLLLLREILSINRAAIFLRQPVTSFGTGEAAIDSRRLRAASAIGLSTNLLQHFELSFDAGIAGNLFRRGRILRRSSEDARADVEVQKEFELLGAEVAVPILDRETVLGVAVFDGRITGEPLVNAELELVFHLLEQLGLALKNIWLHDQLAGNHEMMADILRELSSACVVVNKELVILHANKTARKYFSRGDRRGGELEFSDLPQLLGAKVHQVLKTGAATSSFKYQPEDAPGTVYNINIVPFQRQAGGLPASALLTAEDLTQSEQFKKLEIEAANLRLVKSMSDRLAAEIGNAVVPVSVYQQLMTERWKDSEFRGKMSEDLGKSVQRVTRLVNQMKFLARDSLISQQAFPLVPLLEEAYQEACKHQEAKAAHLNCDGPKVPIVVTGDRAALKHALTEVILNALQANPADPKVDVRLHAEPSGNGLQGLQIEVQDNGPGFSAEALQKAFVPFYTTREGVGPGLGLTVSRKIIETHHGRVEIVAPKSAHSGMIRISLPLDTQLMVQA